MGASEGLLGGNAIGLYQDRFAQGLVPFLLGPGFKEGAHRFIAVVNVGLEMELGHGRIVPGLAARLWPAILRPRSIGTDI